MVKRTIAWVFASGSIAACAGAATTSAPPVDPTPPVVQAAPMMSAESARPEAGTDTPVPNQETGDAGSSFVEGVGLLFGSAADESLALGGFALAETPLSAEEEMTTGASRMGGRDGDADHGAEGGTAAPRPLIDTGATSVQGPLDKDIIRRIIQRNRPRVAVCYERALGKNPGLQGGLAVRFVIDKNGNVADAAAEDVHLASPEAVACVVEVFRSMRFPKPSKDTVVVRYPLRFRPADAPVHDGGSPQDGDAN